MMKRLLLALPFAFVVAACSSDLPTQPGGVMDPDASAANVAQNTCTIGIATYTRGYNANGYNYCARNFNGPADGVDKVLDGTVWGDPTYANDHLVMKWNAAWDACNAFHTDDACAGAWTDNEWNGQVPGGSGETWHYKIQWVGSCGAYRTTLPDGGYCIWGAYEVIFSQGTVANQHF